MKETTLKSPIEYIRQAWAIYTDRNNFAFFARLMAVITLVSASLTYAGSYLFKNPMLENVDKFSFQDIPNLPLYIILLVAGSVFYVYSESTTCVAVLNYQRGYLGKEKEIFRLGYVKMWKFFLISVVLSLVIGLGTILLIIPGLIFFVWYSQSTFLVMDKGLGIKKAFSESKRMVHGKFWKVLGRFLVIGLFAGLVGIFVSIVPVVGSLIAGFLSPLFLLPSYLMYKDLLPKKI